MSKLFFSLYLLITISYSTNVFSAPKAVSSLKSVPKVQQQNNNGSSQGFATTKEDMADFIKIRTDKILTVNKDDVANNKTQNIEHSDEFKQFLENENKSIFEKIYDKATKRVENTYAQQPLSNTAPQQNQRDQWNKPNDIDIVKITLPDHTTVMVPALEHIPYFFSRIEVLKNGLVNFENTAIIVASSKDNKPLTFKLPQSIKNRLGEATPLSYSLINVTINNIDTKYKLTESANGIKIVPVNDIKLESGIYTYNFKFIVDGLISRYDDFSEFYWNITGDSFDQVIAKVGSSIVLPQETKSLGQNVFIGYPNQLSEDLASIESHKNTISTYSKSALLKQEGMYVIASLPNDAISPEAFNAKINRIINNYGDVLLSILGLIAIITSYYISWRYIRLGKVKPKHNIKQNASLLRFFNFGKIDGTSFASFLLELYKKNIIDIEQAEDTILLIKRTDNLKSLTRNEQKAITALFGTDSIFNVNKHNLLKIRRAQRFIEKDVKTKLRIFSLKLNAGYIAFSSAMLLTIELAISFLQYNSLFYFSILALITTLSAVMINILLIKIKNLWLNIITKTFSSIFIILLFFISSVIISPISNIVIIISIYIIIDYTKLYSNKTGLMKFQIAKSIDYKNNLLKNRNNIKMGREFINQQANILACELDDQYPISEQFKDYYKLDIAKNIVQRLG